MTIYDYTNTNVSSKSVRVIQLYTRVLARWCGRRNKVE